jgi:hypothetical protein
MRTRVTLIMSAIAALLALAAFSGCYSNSPTQPNDEERDVLAGSGRLNDNDPFQGGPEISGPRDSIPMPPTYWNVLFYNENDCTGEAGTWLIDNQADWADWWAAATGCLYDPIDSMIIYPQDTLSYPDTLGPEGGFQLPGAEAPIVDFDANSVAIVTLEPDSGAWCRRSLSITGFSADEVSTTIEYEVSLLEGDCCDLLMGPMPLRVPNAPSIAVLVPRPSYTPVTWTRKEVTINCDYPKPDPNKPHTIYYTDAACDLGPTETLITDSSAFVAWLSAAMECDRARSEYWRDRTDTLYIGPGDPDDSNHWQDPLPDTVPVPPMPPYPYYGLNVDFNTHAVIILRAGEQDQWGGGVWLQGISDQQGTTVYEYSVMAPGDNCPPADPALGPFNPTVAIRVPKPADNTVAWNRTEETIRCDWDGPLPDTIWTDSTGGR